MVEDLADYLLERPLHVTNDRDKLHGVGLEADGYELWVARDRRTDGRVTVVLLPTPLCENRALAELLERELARMEDVHRGLETSLRGACEIGAFGWTAQGRLFVALETLEGQSLATHLQRQGRLPEELALSWMSLFAEAVLALQGAGLDVCGSLCPELLWLPGATDLRSPPQKEQPVRILDLGVGRAIAQLQQRQRDRQHLSQFHVLFHGSPLYLAPEQCRGRGEVTAQSDVYALGAILFHLLAGDPPFPAEQPLLTLSRHLEQPPPLEALAVRPATRMLLARMMAKDPAQRPLLSQLIGELAATSVVSPGTPTTRRDAQAAGSTTPALPRLGPYLLQRPLGEGGMARVVEARHHDSGQRCAVKILNEACLRQPRLRERFETEIKAARKVLHPGVVTILDAGVSDSGDPYLVMELLEGETLEQRLGRAPLSLAEVVELGIQVAQAVAAAHACGVIHRDLKPGNLMLLSEHGRLRSKVLDFGIAKVVEPYRLSQVQRIQETQPGEMLGTLKYMAPEQRSDAGQVSDRADVWALGVTLYEVLCGKTPFSNEGVLVQIQRVNPVAPVPLALQGPQLPAPLTTLVNEMLALQPEQRPAMQRVVEALQALQRTPAPRPRRGALAAAVVLVLLLCAGAAMGAQLLRQRQQSQERKTLWADVQRLDEEENYVAALQRLAQLDGLGPSAAEQRAAAQRSERLRCEEAARPLVQCLKRAARPGGDGPAGLACFRRIPACAEHQRRVAEPEQVALRLRWLRERVDTITAARASGRCDEVAEELALLRAEDPIQAGALASSPCAPAVPPAPLPAPLPRKQSAPAPPMFSALAIKALNEGKPALAWSLVVNAALRKDLTSSSPDWAKSWYYAGVAACRNDAPSDATHALQQLLDVGARDRSALLKKVCSEERGLRYDAFRREFVK